MVFPEFPGNTSFWFLTYPNTRQNPDADTPSAGYRMDGAELLVQLCESTPWANIGAGKNKRAVHNAALNGRLSK